MTTSTEIAHLMRTGTREEIAAFLRKQKETHTDFYSFFNELIDKSPFKRSEIAQRAGMSRDYTYKLMRGDKKTSERDYLLALCFAMKLDILETQEVLRLYPFPVLDDEDMRSYIIKAGIMEKIDLDTMNTWLEKASFPLIRTSPDMPSYTMREESCVLYNAGPDIHVFETNTYVDISTDLPCDCIASMKLLVDGDEKYLFIADRYYVSATPSINLEDVDIDEIADYAEEIYPDLASTVNSIYFEYFLDLERDLDEALAFSLENREN